MIDKLIIHRPYGRHYRRHIGGVPTDTVTESRLDSIDEIYRISNTTIRLFETSNIESFFFEWQLYTLFFFT